MTDQIWPFPGSRWWKFDFHTHTPASLCRQTQAWQQAIGTPEEVTPEKWLLHYMEAEIDCVAITDHNTGEWIDKLRAAYEQMKADSPTGFRELHLFSGVELSVQGGVHLLTVFGPETRAQTVNDLLATVRYDGTRGDSDGVTQIGIVDVLDEVTRLGGLAIPAHVDKDKGLLQLESAGSRKSWFDANTLRQVFNRSDVLAVEHIDLNNMLPEVYTEAKAHWARVLGSDSHSFRGSAVPGSRFTWVKMATPSLEGLRLALMDGNGLSLRCSDLRDGFDPFGKPEHFITSIEIRNAKFMGRRQPERIECSPYYNALIGGRGTGKSTVVHVLRLAYRREGDLSPFPDKDSPKAVFDAFRKLRELVKLMDRVDRKVLYTDFEDELGEETLSDPVYVPMGVNMERFRAKARLFLLAHEGHFTIHRLRMNEPLTAMDLEELERMLREAGLGNDEELEKAKRESHGLGLFVRSLVGLNRTAAKAAFAEFLQGSTLNASQIDFLGMVIDHLTEHGAMDPALLYESPYTDINPMGVEGVFNPPQVELLLGVLAEVRQRAVA